MRASMTQHWSAAIGVALLVALVVVGIVSISGFWSLNNLRSTLVLASFLGIASIGQTLCALVGGLDLSIPFVIGAANVGLLGLMNKGLSSGEAIVVTLILAAAGRRDRRRRELPAAGSVAGRHSGSRYCRSRVWCRSSSAARAIRGSRAGLSRATSRDGCRHSRRSEARSGSLRRYSSGWGSRS